MLVFGDQVRALDPRAALGELTTSLEAIAGMTPGLARHAALVGAFIEAGELVQGLTDRACAARDARTPVGDAGMRLLVAIARAVDASWSRGDAYAGAPLAGALAALAAHRLPDGIEARRAEGYAFYALYPEAYLAAARAAPRWPRRVIGIRSIGAGLAAAVAAATGAPLPATVRPRGDPFRRRLDVAPGLVAEWVAGGTARVAIVDEGPGMSGSSFGAVADRLEDHSGCTAAARSPVGARPLIEGAGRRARKYAIVCAIPSAAATCGSQSSTRSAFEISGRRRVGSSEGNGRWSITEADPASSRTRFAICRTVISSGLPRLIGPGSRGHAMSRTSPSIRSA
jgi:hypothetical protein